MLYFSSLASNHYVFKTTVFLAFVITFDGHSGRQPSQVLSTPFLELIVRQPQIPSSVFSSIVSLKRDKDYSGQVIHKSLKYQCRAERKSLPLLGFPNILCRNCLRTYQGASPLRPSLYELSSALVPFLSSSVSNSAGPLLLALSLSTHLHLPCISTVFSFLSAQMQLLMALESNPQPLLEIC